MHIILFLLFGLIVGVGARALVPGKEPGGWFVSMLLGIGGAFVGGFLAHLAGFYGPGQRAGFVMSLLGAIVLVVGYHVLTMRRRLA